MRKLILSLFLLILILPGYGISETTTYDALPIGGAAPYAPVADAYTDDNMAYDDGTLSIRIETEEVYDTTVYYIYVQLTDPSQFRTALAAPYPSKNTLNVQMMAAMNNAVLAVNGDFFLLSFRRVYRSQRRIAARQSP